MRSPWDRTCTFFSLLALPALRLDLLLAAVGYPAALRAVETAFPDVLDDFPSSRPFVLDPVAACPEPLWLGCRAAELVAAFLSAVADATCHRSQCGFPLYALPSASALRRLLDLGLPLRTPVQLFACCCPPLGVLWPMPRGAWLVARFLYFLHNFRFFLAQVAAMPCSTRHCLVAPFTFAFSPAHVLHYRGTGNVWHS